MQHCISERACRKHNCCAPGVLKRGGTLASLPDFTWPDRITCRLVGCLQLGRAARQWDARTHLSTLFVFILPAFSSHYRRYLQLDPSRAAGQWDACLANTPR